MWLILAILLASMLTSSPTVAQSLWTSAECGGTSITVSWNYQDSGTMPEFVGYDLYRQSLSDCAELLRLNDQPFPRQPGVPHGHTFVDGAIVQETMYRYEVVLVDANRDPIGIPAPPNGFCDPCVREAWQSCPDLSAPLAHGTLWGDELFAFVIPCPNSCYSDWAMFEPPAELLPLLNTSTAVLLWGTGACGTVEGCLMEVTDFAVVPCGAMPVEPSTWGAVKATYR